MERFDCITFKVETSSTSTFTCDPCDRGKHYAKINLAT